MKNYRKIVRMGQVSMVSKGVQKMLKSSGITMIGLESYGLVKLKKRGDVFYYTTKYEHWLTWTKKTDAKRTMSELKRRGFKAKMIKMKQGYGIFLVFKKIR